MLDKKFNNDDEEDIDKETAMAKAIEGLTVYEPEKAIVLTEFTQKEINGFVTLLSWDKFIKKMGAETDLINTISEKFILHKISKSRKGKKELVEVLKAENKKEEAGAMDKFKGLFGRNKGVLE